jgi:hypothetical protein
MQSYVCSFAPFGSNRCPAALGAVQTWGMVGAVWSPRLEVEVDDRKNPKPKSLTIFPTSLDAS